MPGSKHWCFTLNNYTDENQQKLRQLAATSKVNYLIFGRESAPDTGTLHLQGYVGFRRRFTRIQVIGLVGQAHLEKAKGKPLQAANYCRKGGDYEEFGQCPIGQGARTDLVKACEAFVSGRSLQDLTKEYPVEFVKYHRGLERLRQLQTKPRNWITEVYVFWGDTGSGKTREAFSRAPGAYFKPPGKWFGLYDGESDVIFDDFGGSECKLTDLLKLLDRYPCDVEVKGGFVRFVPKRIFITSNRKPEEWYPNAHPEHVAALRRRFTQVLHFSIPFQ